MKQYTISAAVTISIYTKVQAASESEALEIAEHRGMIGLCHQCAGGRDVDECWVTSGELDGTAADLKVDAE